MDVHGGTPIRLTNNSANNVSPAYISVTNQIGFVSDLQNGWNIHTINTFGKNFQTITNNRDTPVDYPSWSPDGKLIAASLAENCTPSVTTCNYDIYVMNADGTNRKKITDTTASEWVPVWAPDGQRIAFASDRDDDGEIYVMDKDGSNVLQLTNNKGYDGSPRWSPDGTKLVFESDRDGGDWDIFIMNADGTAPEPVTENTSSDYSASWSPDGNWLVYLSNLDGDNEIFIIDKHGQNQQRLTNNAYNDKSPIWIP